MDDDTFDEVYAATKNDGYRLWSKLYNMISTKFMGCILRCPNGHEYWIMNVC